MLKDTEGRNLRQIEFLKNSHEKQKTELITEKSELMTENARLAARLKELEEEKRNREEKTRKIEQLYLQMGQVLAPKTITASNQLN